MPISSGATGRVDVGIDTSISWTPDHGVKQIQGAKPSSNGPFDSYLKRYLEINQMGKKRLNENTIVGHDPGPQDSTLLTGFEGTTQADVEHKNGQNGDFNTSRKSSEDSLKKSKTCTLL